MYVYQLQILKKKKKNKQTQNTIIAKEKKTPSYCLSSLFHFIYETIFVIMSQFWNEENTH